MLKYHLPDDRQDGISPYQVREPTEPLFAPPPYQVRELTELLFAPPPGKGEAGRGSLLEPNQNFTARKTASSICQPKYRCALSYVKN